MKKILLLFFILFFTSLASFAIEDIPDDVEISNDENLQEEQQLELDKSDTLKIKVLKQEEIEEYLRHGLSINIDGKILKEIRMGGAFQGKLSYETFQGTSDGRVNYSIPVGDVYIMAQFADKHQTEMKFMINPARTVKGISYFPGILQDYYISTKPTQNTKLLIGQARTPNGLEGGQSEYTLPFVYRSQISRTYGNTRELGVRFMGEHKWLDYDLGIYDSSRYCYHMFMGADFTGRVIFHPMANLDANKYGKLNVGTSYQVGKRYTSYSVWGAFLEYEYKKLRFTTEYAYANGYNGAVNSSAQSNGFYTTLAYKIHPKVELVGRYDLFTPDMNKSNNDRTEITAGINYYVFGNNLKFMLDYVFKLYKDQPNSNALYFLTQFMI